MVQIDLLEYVGRYQIVGELGLGSMSRVFLAHDPNLDRKVALKVVLRGLSLDRREQGELERRFLLEARAAGKLTHPNIVRVYDADTDEATGVPYIAMEWVQGHSLRSMLEDGGRLTGLHALQILAQVAKALDYAHQSARIHRDIKPSNILVGADGIAKVSDFGVAKIVTETHTISGQVVGTPAYMSPEQVRDEPLDGRSDLFSLGAVLYQCVAGESPFGADSLVQVVYKILNVDPRPIKLQGSPGSSRLLAVVERSIQKDPARRFQTGAEFALALDDVAQILEREPASDFRAGRTPEVDPRATDTVQIDIPALDESATAAAAGQDRSKRLPRTTKAYAVGQAPSAQRTVGLDSAVTREVPLPSRRRPRRLPILLLFALLAIAAGWASRFLASEATEPTLRPRHLVPTTTPSPTASDALEIPDIEPPPALESIEPISPSSIDRFEISQSAPTRVSLSSGDPPATAIPRDAVEAADPTAVSSPVDIRLQSSAAEPGPAVLTPVSLLYRHRGGLAYLTVLLDGVRVWSQELKAVEGRLQKLSGYETRAVVAVPSGEHTLEIQLSDPQRGVDAVAAIRSRYTNGRRRTLRVNLDPGDNQMVLRWKE